MRLKVRLKKKKKNYTCLALPCYANYSIFYAYIDYNMQYLRFLMKFFFQESLSSTLKHMIVDYEKTLHIIYQPQAVFRVRGVTR